MERCDAIADDDDALLLLGVVLCSRGDVANEVKERSAHQRRLVPRHDRLVPTFKPSQDLKPLVAGRD